VIVTAILVPIITALYAKRFGSVEAQKVEQKAVELHH
jgi:2-keto-3-deoxygluconate permease